VSVILSSRTEVQVRRALKREFGGKKGQQMEKAMRPGIRGRAVASLSV
jgi:hypothetical protein